MPIEVTYDQNSGILKSRLTGQVSLQEMNDALLQVLNSSDIPSDANGLWDVSDMEFSDVTIDFQRALIDLRKKNAVSRGNAKIAILCTYSLANPLVKLYTILSQELDQPTQMFSNEQDAIAWLQQ